MKRIYFLFLLIPALIFSCSLLEDATTEEFDTDLAMDIPVSVSAPAAINIKSAVADYPFSRSGVARLSDVGKISDYLDHIESVDIKDLKLVFGGLQAGQEVKTISVSVTGVGVIATVTGVTNSNTTHSPTVNSAKLNQVATILKSTKEIEVVVSGDTNDAPMAFNVNAKFGLKVTASAL